MDIEFITYGLSMFLFIVNQNVMKIILPIAFLLLFQISCSNKKTELGILNGEWITDTLNTKNSDNWKEFIYFKNGKILAHTTWWGRNYVLNENQNILNEQFKDNQNNIYKIKVIDSSEIEIIGNNYYARFKKDKNQPENINSEILEFKKSQNNKQKLTGKWKISSIQKKLDKEEFQNEPIYKELLKSSDFDKFLYFSTKEIDFIQFNYTIFSAFLKNKKKINLDYIVNIDSIDLYVGDVIYKIHYKLSENKMVYKNFDKIGITTEIVFSKSH